MLKNKIALITGVSGGIGFQTAQLFIENGCTVIGLDRIPPVKELSDIHFYQCDLRNSSQIKQVANEINKDYTIDILVNCAGITNDGLTLNMSENDFDIVIDVNLKSVWLLTKELVPNMIKKGSGSIINVSSVVAEYGNIGQSNYSASKAALIGLTKTWAKEFSRKGSQIRVNVICPGYTLTDMVKNVPDYLLNKFVSQTMLGRLAQPIEIANAIMFLASDMASYITGSVLDVNGGMRL